MMLKTNIWSDEAMILIREITWGNEENFESLHEDRLLDNVLGYETKHAIERKRKREGEGRYVMGSGGEGGVRGDRGATDRPRVRKSTCDLIASRPQTPTICCLIMTSVNVPIKGRFHGRELTLKLRLKYCILLSERCLTLALALTLGLSHLYEIL
jgi:hypothetical protein